MIRKIILAILGLFLFALPAQALTTYYVDTDCGTPGDGTTNVCSGATAPYASQAAFIAARAGVLADDVLVLVQGAAVDTAAADYNGFTTGIHTLTIQGNATATGRHSGVWDTGKYRIVNDNYYGAIRLRSNRIVIDGIQIENTRQTDGRSNGIEIDSGADIVKVTNCIIRYVVAVDRVAYSGQAGITSVNNDDANPQNYIFVNNIIYGFSGAGIAFQSNGTTGSTYIVYNNTIVDIHGSGTGSGIYYGRYGTTPTFNIKNNLLYDNESKDYSVDGVAGSLTTATNLTSDGTSPDALGGKTISFEGPPDYHIAATDYDAIGTGTDLHADASYPFSTDIDGDSITNWTWCIGADYRAGGGGGPSSSSSTTTSSSGGGCSASYTSSSGGSDQVCGVDTDKNGIYDKWCMGVDRDRDGYTTDGSGLGFDCDDHDRFVYPGIAVGCDAGGGANTGWKTCETDCGWSACTANASTAYCPTGCAACYYVDAVGGNDANAGTFASPWKSYKQFTTYYTPGDRPAGWVDVIDGSGHGRCFLFMSGTYADYYTYDIYKRGLYIRSKNANASYPFRFMAYPGQVPVIDLASTSGDPYSPITIHQSSNALVEGFHITGNYCEQPSAGTGCIDVTESSNVEVRNNVIYDNDGSHSSTFGGITLHDTIDLSTGGNNIHHNVLWDNKDSSAPDNQNNANILVWYPHDAKINNNISFYTLTDVTNETLFNKHGQYQGSIETKGNVFLNGWVRFSSPNVVFQNNLVEHAYVHWGDHGGTAYQHDIEVINNTFESSIIGYDPVMSYDQDRTYHGGDVCASDAPIGGFTFSGNVVVDDKLSYTIDTRPILIWPFGPDYLYTDVVSGGKLHFSANCYYNPNTAMTFGLWEGYNATTCALGGTGTLGGSNSFAQWVALGLDNSGSYEENPQLNADEIAVNPNCLNYGWQTTYGGPPPAIIGGPNGKYRNKRVVWRVM